MCRQVSVFVSVLGWRSRNEVEEYKYTVASMENENKTNYMSMIRQTFLASMVNEKQNTLQHSTLQYDRASFLASITPCEGITGVVNVESLVVEVAVAVT